MTPDPDAAHRAALRAMAAEAQAIRATGAAYEEAGARRERDWLHWQVTQRIEQLEADGHERVSVVLRELYGLLDSINIRTRRAGRERAWRRANG